MKAKKIVAVYPISVGVMMLSIWAILFGTNQVPEIETKTLSISFHLLAEFLTAVLLIIGGFGLLTNRKWGFQLYLLSMGMLLYAVLNACGYYAQKGEWIEVCMFIILSLITAFIVVKKLKKVF